MSEEKYYNFQDILKFLSFDWEFDKENNKKYPFNKGKENVTFSWGQILIPRYGIREVVKNKISNVAEMPISKITMMYQIPFIVDGKVGVVNKNITLSFRYDKQFKYGDITKSIEECCFWILEHAVRTNDFYIITDDLVQMFFTECVIDNQWGLGSLEVCSPPNEKFGEAKHL